MSNKLKISASQLDDFIACPRRWWFKRVMRLKEVQKDYFTFGTVLHGCIERWMAATDKGRVPSPVPEVLRGQRSGQPVEVFPIGWEKIIEKGRVVSVTPNEAQLIRKLFNEAVERGIITRDPKSTVERKIDLPVLDGVELTGKIDLHKAGETLDHEFQGEVTDTVAISVPEIHDHKSFGKSSTRYLKQDGPTDEGGNLIPIVAPYKKGDGTSPNSIGHNQQVLTYAAASSRLDGYHGPVLVRHNQFPKFNDPKGVRHVKALVSGERLEQHWKFVQDKAKEMVLVSGIKKWTDTPGPESLDACSQYGGCSFQGICGKKESTDVYSKRIERTLAGGGGLARLNLPLDQPKRKSTKGDTTNMDIFQRAKDQQAARAGTAVASPSKTATAKKAANPQKPVAVNSTPAPEQTVVSDGAPWANPTCPACNGLGINTKGRACPICDKTSAKQGKPTSSMFVIELDQDGTITAVAKEDQVEALEAMGAETAWAGEVPKPATAAAPAAAPKAKPKPAPAPEPEPVEEPTEVEAEGEEAEGEESEEVPAEMPPAAVPAPSPRDAARAALLRKGTTPAPTPAAPVKAQQKPASEAPARAAGRPRTGISIFIGATPLKSPERPLMLATQLLEKVGAELAADMGAASYWELEPFKRRERIRQKSAEIAEGLGKVMIVASSTNDPDVLSLINGLSAAPSCEWVIEGLR